MKVMCAPSLYNKLTNAEGSMVTLNNISRMLEILNIVLNCMAVCGAP